jgi:hypothetical protein
VPGTPLLDETMSAESERTDSRRAGQDSLKSFC